VDVEVTTTDTGASTANAWLGRAKMLTKAKARAAATDLFTLTPLISHPKEAGALWEAGIDPVLE
jgi:hypothetical protein